MIFSHRGVQHQDFTKKNSHCFCLYKIHTQNNYVEQGKSCNIISLFCVKPKVICGKKLSSNLTRIYHFLLGLIGHGNFIECTYVLLGWFPKQRTFTRIYNGHSEKSIQYICQNGKNDGVGRSNFPNELNSVYYCGTKL